MNIYKYLKNIAFALLALVIASCGNPDTKLHSKADLEGSHVAVLEKAVSDKDFKKQLPGSHAKHLKSSSEFLLTLSTGKCDAGIVEKQKGLSILKKRSDYAALPYGETDSTLLIAHKSILAVQGETAHDGNAFSRLIDRLDESLVSHGYWRLILQGFSTTISIFLLAIIQAFILAILLIWMNGHKYIKYISKPLSYFIKTIHDVPSIVLIFFFYYFVFASTNISATVVCSIALGVYTSSSLMKIFKVYLGQIDKTQHFAAQMLGLNGWKKYRYVILPQAIKPMQGFLGSEAKRLLRATSYVGYISELDLVKVTEVIRNQTYEILIPLLLVSIIFLVLSHIIVETLSVICNKAFKND